MVHEDSEIAASLRPFADEHGFISRDSMRKALIVTLGAGVSDGALDTVMRRLGTSDSDVCGNSIVSIAEAEAALVSFHKGTLDATPYKRPVTPSGKVRDISTPHSGSRRMTLSRRDSFGLIDLKVTYMFPHPFDQCRNTTPSVVSMRHDNVR